MPGNFTIVCLLNSVIIDDATYQAMSKAHNPYGDGQAAGRIVKVIEGLQ